MNPLKQLAGQTAVYGLSTIVPRFLNILLVPLYTWFFVPSEYGVVTELYAYVVFLNVVLTYGLETAFFKFSQDNASSLKVYSTILFSIFTTSTFFVVLIYFLSGSIASVLGYESNPEYIWIFGFIIAIDAVCAIPFVKLRKENRAFRFASLKLISVGINVLLNLCFIVLFPKLHANGVLLPYWLYNPSYGLGYIFISNLIASAFTFLLLFKEFSFKGGFDKMLLKRILFYSIPLLLAGMAGSINEALDRILIKHLLPNSVDANEMLGIYGANIKIAVILILFVQTFRFAAEPFFFNYEKEKDSKLLFASIMNYFVVACLIIVFACIVNIDILKYFIGPAYWSGLFIVPILLFANLFFGIYVYLSAWYKLSGKTMAGAYIVAIGAVVTVVTNVFLIPEIGILAAAFGHLFCYIVMCVVCYYWGKKHYFIPYDILRLVKYIGIAVLLSVVFYYVPFQSVGQRLVIGNIMLILFAYLLLKHVGLVNLIFRKK